MTAAEIIEIVSAETHVPVNMILGQRRNMHVTDGRHVAAWILRVCGYSWPRVGYHLGRRHHATAMAAYRTVERSTKARNPTYRQARLATLAVRVALAVSRRMEAEEMRAKEAAA